MKQISKRLFGAFLAIIMLLAIVPNGVFQVQATGSNPRFPVDKGLGSWYGLTYYGHDGNDKYQYSAIDLNMPNNADNHQNVYAVQAGVVTSVSPVIISHSVPLILKNSYTYSNWYSIYGHMDNIQVKQWQTVKIGDLLGKVSNVGAETPHLHFALYSNYTNSIDSSISPYWLPGDYDDYNLYADDANGNRVPAGLYETLIFRPMPTQTPVVVQNNYSTGDIIEFGTYPQTKVTNSTLISVLNSQTLQADSTVTYGGLKYKKVYFTQYNNSWPQSANGYYTNKIYWFKYEPIQWRVLSNSSDELFVMAEKILDSKAYNQVNANVTWESCTMRSWLNNDFYNTAFSSTEKAQINTSNVVNAVTSWEGREGGNNTNDKLFLLSNAELVNPSYGFSLSHFTYDTARQAQGTDFSKSNGLIVKNDNPYLGNSFWWLRSPGDDYNKTKLGYFEGCVGGGTAVDGTCFGVRPAFRLNLNSTTYENFNYNPYVYSKELAVKCAEYFLHTRNYSDIKKTLETQYFTNVVPYNLGDTNADNASFFLARKKVIYNNQERNLTVVIIRGTEGAEWKGNMDVTGSSYINSIHSHQSYSLAVTDVLAKLEQYLGTDKNSLVLVTGFSRGAAIANLLAAELDAHWVNSKVGDVFAYTFATPNTTNDPLPWSNIFNFSFDDDFVPNSLSSWGWGKNGFTKRAVAQDLYQSCVPFKNEMKAKWGGNDPCFNAEYTSQLMNYIGSKWKDLSNYYKVTNGFSLYRFMSEVVAPAAYNPNEANQNRIKGYWLGFSIYQPIAKYFVLGQAVYGFIKDTHNEFTYYCALKNGGFDVCYSKKAKSQEVDGTTSPINPNQIEVNKLIAFAQQDDNLQKLGWDINDCSTWKGITWDNEAENRMIDINISFLELSGALDLTGFTSLTNLDCSGNGLTSINLTNCISLQNANCAYNLLSTLSAENLTSLTTLNCIWNNIETLNIDGCTSLLNLKCNDNLLSELNVETNTLLTDLYCGDNNLTAIDLSNNTQLINLSCEDNCFDIQSGSNMMKAIEMLSQKDGTWVMYDPQKLTASPVFNTSDLSKLTAFANQYNNLSKLCWDLSNPQEWYGVKWIKANNEYYVKTIYVSNLSLSGDLDFSGMTNLTYLNISGNQLPNINISTCPKLVYINCNNSVVQVLNISNCPKLLTVNCEQNYLDISSGSTLLTDINQVALKENSEVNYSTQYILAGVNAFNTTEYNTLSTFAQAGDNLTQLGWDLSKPGEWSGIVWESVTGEYRVKGISIEGELISGSVDLTDFSRLKNVNFGSTKITSISLPTSLTEIQESAFSDCDVLASISLPDSILSIGEKAFNNCSKLGNVTIPSNVKEIDDNAFAGCAAFTNVFIPSNIENLGEGVFSNCLGIDEVTVDGNNLFYSIENGVLFDKDKNILILCPATKIGAYEIPSSVKKIESGAFVACTGLTSISVPNSVTDIEVLAFSDCSNLTKITIPSNNTSMKFLSIVGCENLIIYCSVDSYAEAYAISNAISYVLYPEIRKISGSSTVIDRQDYLIYGLSEAITSFDGIIEPVGNATIEITPSVGLIFGTGSKVRVIFDGDIVKTYEIVIFGDINGDGNIDTNDADMIVDIGNYVLPQWDPVTGAANNKAGDVFRDGVIDENDFDVMVDVQNYKLNIDQSTGIASKTESIGGSVGITGLPNFGNVLTADTANIIPTGATLSYQWKRGEENIGSESTYTITVEDIGQPLTVTVTGTGGYTGSITSDAVVIIE